MKHPVLKDLKSAIMNPTWVCFAWLGLTVGISLLAVPAIFTAPSVARAQALDAASAAFAALSQAELLLLVLLLVIIRVAGQARRMWAFVSALALIVLAQAAWLLPELASRAQLIVQGIEPAASPAHAIYAGLEIAKVLLLLFMGFRASR